MYFLKSLFLDVEIQSLTVCGKIMTLLLISRRSRFKLGPRFHSRGIDEKGHVSNFVETEQLVYFNETKEMSSYVQVRGSMPFYWSQLINLRYTPQLLIDSNQPWVCFLALI